MKVHRLSAAASSAILPVWRDPGALTVHAVFDAAVYLTRGTRMIAVVAHDAVRQPMAVVVGVDTSARPFAGMTTRTRAHLEDSRLRLDGLRVEIARWWRPRPVVPPPDTSGLLDRVARVERRLAQGERDGGLADHARDVAAALARGDVDVAMGHAARIVGLGPGLTPAGDDLLAGLVAGVQLLAADERRQDDARRLGQRVAEHATSRTTAISAALLRHAADGEVNAETAEVVRHLAGMSCDEGAVGRLLSIGASSGRELATGLVLAAHAVAGTPIRSGPAQSPLEGRAA